MLLSGAAYLAAEGLTAPLEEELSRRGVAVRAWHGLLALTDLPPVRAAWALNTWLAPEEHVFDSVGEAAALLRGMQRNWGSYQASHFRRAALIGEKLPKLAPKPIAFPHLPPAGHLGAWTLLSPTHLLASRTQSSAFINGAPVFIEDRVGPPSRAYLKLWEACTVLGTWPQPGETCLDLGACPGGWTWALGQLGALVTAVDKAPLDPAVAAMPGVAMRLESAFALDPRAEPAVDWLFSDIVAYPARLLRLVQAWIEADRVGRVVCTVKFQGATDHDAADAFAAIPGGRLVHLFQNKHELTFFWSRTP